MFDLALDPATRCWVLGVEGDWVAAPASGEQVREYQVELMRRHGADG